VSSRRTDRSLASLLLAQRLVDSHAEPLGPKEFWAVVTAVGEPERLLPGSTSSGDSQAFSSELTGRIAHRMASATSLAFELERLEQSGLSVLSALDDDYPAALRERLGSTAPPILHAVGNLDLLAQSGIGVVGSRNADAEALGVAASVAREAAARGLPVVSGGARGIDQESMTAALDAGGTAVGVLADSLSRQVTKPHVRKAILEGRLCICTPYKPTAGFSVANAMGRNRLIYALSELTLVVTSDSGQGGTWEGAVEAIRGRLTDVVIWEGAGAGPGNAALIALGGRPADSVADVLVRGEAASPRPFGSGQMSLGL
jgi:predicted Rossmann fold nucleotide-binding protein DprA/Smf involved in DNA uptake